MYLIEKKDIWSTGIRVSSVLIALIVLSVLVIYSVCNVLNVICAFFVLYVYAYYWLAKYTCIR